MLCTPFQHSLSFVITRLKSLLFKPCESGCHDFKYPGIKKLINN
jgi:hypothetical protein